MRSEGRKESEYRPCSHMRSEGRKESEYRPCSHMRSEGRNLSTVPVLICGFHSAIRISNQSKQTCVCPCTYVVSGAVYTM